MSLPACCSVPIEDVVLPCKLVHEAHVQNGMLPGLHGIFFADVTMDAELRASQGLSGSRGSVGGVVV